MSLVGAAFTKIRGEHLYLAMIDNSSEKICTMMLFYNGEKVVGQHAVNSKIRSVSSHRTLEFAVSVDKFGNVVEATDSDVEFGFIEGPGTGAQKKGYLKSVAYIGDDIYACGDLCQLYHRVGGQWSEVAKEFQVEDKLSVGQALNSLDGFSQDEVYAVGDRGKIVFLTENGWSLIDSVTNVSLEKVKCFENGCVYVVGGNGVVLVGRNDKWNCATDALRDAGSHDTLWDIEIYRENVYVISSSELYVLDEKELKKIPLPMSELDGGSNIQLLVGFSALWLVKANALLSYDGSDWKTHDFSVLK